jgi:zinc resistance-associated protein
MWKAIFAGTTAITVIGASLVYAQQTPPAQPNRDSQRFSRPTLSPEDRAALTDARVAGLKAGLKLTPAQEKNWPAVEAALRDRAKLRADRFERFQKMREQRRADPAQRGDMLERMKSRADDMATSAASLKKLTDAIDPLYKSLDDGQKQRFALLYRAGGDRRQFWFRGGPGGPDMGPPQQSPDRRGPAPRQRRTERMDRPDTDL